MTRQRVLIDIEFAVDEAGFKVARLARDETGVSDVTAASVREAVTIRLVQADWAGHGLVPQRSTVTTRVSTPDGVYIEVLLPAETGVLGE